MIFFFNDTATTEIYTLSLHDALPIFCTHLAKLALMIVSLVGRTIAGSSSCLPPPMVTTASSGLKPSTCSASRSEEHTSELQSRQYLVCRLLLEKKKNKSNLVTLLHQL